MVVIKCFSYLQCFDLLSALNVASQPNLVEMVVKTSQHICSCYVERALINQGAATAVNP